MSCDTIKINSDGLLLCNDRIISGSCKFKNLTLREQNQTVSTYSAIMLSPVLTPCSILVYSNKIDVITTSGDTIEINK